MSTTDHISVMVEDLAPGCVILRYVVLAEVLDEDGDRALWSDSHEGATRWDIYGILMEALETEKARHHRQITAADDED